MTSLNFTFLVPVQKYRKFHMSIVKQCLVTAQDIAKRIICIESFYQTYCIRKNLGIIADIDPCNFNAHNYTFDHEQ